MRARSLVKKIIKTVFLYFSVFCDLITFIGVILCVMHDNFYDIFRGFFELLEGLGIEFWQIGLATVISFGLGLLLTYISINITISFDEY